MNKYKSIQYCERISNPDMQLNYTAEPQIKDHKVFTQKEVNINGVLCKQTQVKLALDDNIYRASDFKLENIIAVGAYNMLTPRSLNSSTLNSVDNITANLSSLEQSINQQNS